MLLMIRISRLYVLQELFPPLKSTCYVVQLLILTLEKFLWSVNLDSITVANWSVSEHSQ